MLPSSAPPGNINPGGEPPISPAAAWVARADELADWALARLVVRTDRFGGYYRKDGRAQKSARPNKGCPAPFSRELAVRHFRATRTDDVIGAFALTAGDGGVGRWVCIDIDAHGPEDDPERNRKYALHIYERLVRLGFRPLLVTWGGGGYHLWALFARELPGAVLFAFGRWLVSDAAEFGYPKPPEAFPKQRAVAKYGNWIRLPGRHHTRDVFASVFASNTWVEGATAVAFVLSLTGDGAELIPPGAAPVDKPPRGAKKGAAPNGGGGWLVRAGGGRADRPSVFEAYNRTVTDDTIVSWLEPSHGTVCARSAERVEFTRAGKDGGQSFNIKNVDGVWVTFNFSTAADLPEGAGLSPSQLRCFLKHGRCDTATMAGFARELERELGWVKDEDEEKGAEGNVEGEKGGTGPADRGEERTAAACGAAAPAEESQDRFGDTDLANAKRFVADHGERVLYASDMRRWFVFDGRRWAEDASEGIVRGLAQQTARRMAEDAFKEMVTASKRFRDAETEDEQGKAAADLKRAKDAMSWAKKTQDIKRLTAMVEGARPSLMVTCARDVLDREPHLLNVANGTVELRTGELRAHDRGDFLTKLCPTAYDPNATAPNYLRFLGSVLGSPEEVDYVRRFSGVAVTGEVTSQVMHIFQGVGSNGKNVLLDLWQAVLGEVAGTAPAEIVADHGEKRHPTEKTVLRGRRLVVCDESDEDERLNAKRVKQLTGGGNIVARGMKQDFYEFPPTHKLVLSTNFLPEVRTNDHATWRRIRLVQFPRVYWTEADRLREPRKEYPEHLRADPGLPDRLRREAEGVLADMVAHAVQFYARNRVLDPPARVMQAVSEYQKREDVVGAWLDLHTEAAPFDRDDPERGVRGEKGIALYKWFADWHLREVDPDKDNVPSKRNFCTRLAGRFKSRPLNGIEHYAVRVVYRSAQPPQTGDEGGGSASGEVENFAGLVLAPYSETPREAPNTKTRKFSTSPLSSPPAPSPEPDAVPMWWALLTNMLHTNGEMPAARLVELSGYDAGEVEAALRHYVAAGVVEETGGVFRVADVREVPAA